MVVANLESQDIRIFDRETKRFLVDRDANVGAKAFMPAFVDAATLLVPLQAPDGLVRIDAETGSVRARRVFPPTECLLPHAVAVAKDRRAYVVCEGDHATPGAVVEVDATTLEVRHRWAVGIYPDGIAFGE